MPTNKVTPKAAAKKKVVVENKVVAKKNKSSKETKRSGLRDSGKSRGSAKGQTGGKSGSATRDSGKAKQRAGSRGRKGCLPCPKKSKTRSGSKSSAKGRKRVVSTGHGKGGGHPFLRRKTDKDTTGGTGKKGEKKEKKKWWHPFRNIYRKLKKNWKGRAKKVKGEYPERWEPPPFDFIEYDHKIGRHCANKIRSCFMLMTWVLGILGRFPLHCGKNKKGVTEFNFMFFTFNSGLFYVTSLTLCAMCGIATFGLIGYALEWPWIEDEIWKPEFYYRAEERYFVWRNAFISAILVMLGANVLVSTWVFMTRPCYASKYFTNFGDSIEILQLDVTQYSLNFCKVWLGVYLILFALMCGLSIAHYAPVTAGAGGVLAWSQARIFKGNVLESDSFPYLRGTGTFFFMYMLLISRIYLFVYIFILRVLQSVLLEWNLRLNRILNYTDMSNEKNKAVTQWGMRHLFKEHVVILDLMEGTDKMFAGIVETYYFSMIISIGFEFYYLLKSFTNPYQFDAVRTRDWTFMSLYFAQSLLMLTLVSSSGSAVYESAMQGMEVCRKKGMMGKHTNTQLYLIFTLFKSYLGVFPMAPRGGGHFYIYKPWLVMMGSQMVSTIVLFIQVNPKCLLDLNNEVSFAERLYLNAHRRQVLLSVWEGTRFTENEQNPLLHTLNITSTFYWKDYDFFANTTGQTPTDVFFDYYDQPEP